MFIPWTGTRSKCSELKGRLAGTAAKNGDQIRVPVRKGYFASPGLPRYLGKRYFDSKEPAIGKSAEKRAVP